MLLKQFVRTAPAPDCVGFASSFGHAAFWRLNSIVASDLKSIGWLISSFTFATRSSTRFW
jgi:hypothetical protein